MKSFCYYCEAPYRGQKTWVAIGGTFGERHYHCHRRKCREQWDEARRRFREPRVALRGRGPPC